MIGMEGIFKSRKKGKLLIIVGEMRGGKSEELIRQIKRNIYAKKVVQIFKPIIDTRDNDAVISRNGESIKAIQLDGIKDLMRYLSADTDIVALDETHFFDEQDTINVINALLKMGVSVIASGLDMDYSGKPFSVMSYLMAIAEDVMKLHAICECGEDAWVSHRVSDSQERIQVGDDTYIPLCRSCFEKKKRLEKVFGKKV